MNIRWERENDYLEVEKLVRDSFWNIYRPGAFEHYIVHNLRKDESFLKDLAYVIEKDDKIIGHINYSNGILKFEDGDVCKVPILGPVAIDRDYQNKGYGSELINFTLDLIEKKNIAYVFVVGDEHYYERFVFESASKYNMHLEGTDMSEECPFFMIKVFDINEINYKTGIFQNPEVFNVDESDVDEFDKKFEFKEKKVLKGQL